MPLVLADAAFLSALKQVDQQVTDLKIVDAQSNQQAADLLQRLTTAGKKLNEARLSLKRRFDPVLAKIDETARGPIDRIDKLKKILGSAQIQWAAEQKKIADKAEADRLADVARLEKLRAAEEAEAKRIADELAAKAKKDAEELAAAHPAEMDIDFGDEKPAPPAPPPQKTEIQKQLEAVKHAPAVVAPKASGVRFKTTLEPVIVNINLVPEMFVEKSAKIAAIKSTFCSGWKEGEPMPECGGVRFDVKKTVESTGPRAI